MDDLAYGIKYPAVLDSKIGKVTHDPEASIEKIERQKLKYPDAEEVGFQLIGMRVFDKPTKTFKHYDKIFGRALDKDDVIHGLALFYQFHHTPRTHAVKETIKNFESIQRWFEKQKTYHFYSSSVIVVYNAIDESESGDNNTKLASSVRIKIADFAHVFPANSELDENYLFGINNLVEHLKLLISPTYVFKDVR